MSRKAGAKRARRSNLIWIAVLAFAICAVGVAFLLWPKRLAPKASPRIDVAEKARASDWEIFRAYAGSQSCRDCHTNAYASWQRSHHGLAERPVHSASDRDAFEPARVIKHGTQTSEARSDGDRVVLRTLNKDKVLTNFVPERVIGEFPLRQFMVPEQGGRYQVTELAFDPAKKEWFNVYGEEDRQPGEWGHWTGRGMTWNQMCASCHNTRLRKHYDPDEDLYRTSMAEMGVGCEACHGPMADHVAWQKPRQQPAKGDPTIKKLDHSAIMAVCGMCHARRGEITGEFVPGERFSDHFLLTSVDETDIYHADGQVRDENYEYGSFLSSKMFTSGVWCMDCHEPHAAKVKTQGNALCMRCHGNVSPPAPRIDEAKHSFHPPGKGGSLCVDCHMPLTTYMQRHPRRDHGFTIPDPLLTKQHGVPNACNRCHTDKTTEWSIEYVEKWYGKRMDRSTRSRAQAVAIARTGQTNSIPELTRFAASEKNGLWRASATRLLGQFAGATGVKAALIERSKDRNPLVRANAAHSLSQHVQAEDAEAIAAVTKLLEDESRGVRIEAAWTLHATLDTNTLAGRDLVTSLLFNSDQPAGAMQQGAFMLDRGDAAGALPWFEKAVSWDPNSAPIRDALAVCYSSLGRTTDAVRELEQACRIAPREAPLRYRLGLALSEAGRLAEAINALEAATKTDATFAPAWYNLGLGYSQAERFDEALTALIRAESLEPDSPRAPYARATILARLGRTDEARRAAQRALEIRRDFREAQELIRALQ